MMAPIARVRCDQFIYQIAGRDIDQRVRTEWRDKHSVLLQSRAPAFNSRPIPDYDDTRM
jgi:hypothetical protein